MPKHSIPRVIYRCVSGRPLDGRVRTDCTYLRPGIRALTPTGRTTRWAMLPGWQRAAIRLGVPAIGYGAHTAYSLVPTYTSAAASILAAVGTLRVAHKARRAFRLRRFTRAYTRPTVAALRHALGGADVELAIDPTLGNLMERLTPAMSQGEKEWRARYAKHVEPWVRAVPDRAWKTWAHAKRRVVPLSSRLDRWRRPTKDHGPSIVFTAPHREWLTEEQRVSVASIIEGKVPVADLTAPQWDAVGPTVTARWTVRKRPPKDVGRADFEARSAGLPEHEYWVGLAAGNQSVKVSLKADNPHIGISAASGAGKSVLAQLLIVQTLQRGGEVYILDVKGSHRWAYGLPGVTYCRTEAEIHAAWVDLGALAKSRNDHSFHNPAAVDGWRRVLVIAEELNALMDGLADYWAEERESARDRDPAMRGMRDILRMGRSAKVNIVAIAQRLSAAAAGNGDARENLGSALFLARFSSNTQKMLCQGVAMPRSSNHLGRWVSVMGGKATEVQVCFLEEWDARLIVLASAPAPSSACPPGRTRALVGETREMSADDAPQASQPDMPTDPLSELLTLKEAADREIVPWASEAARKRLKRAQERNSPSIPQQRGKRGQAELYAISDLITWAMSERVR